METASMSKEIIYFAQAAPAPADPSAAPAASGPAVKTETKQSTSKDSQANSSPGGMSSLLLPILLIVVFYFILIRPQQKKEKQRQNMLKTLNKGDKILTRGGIWGVVVNVKEDGNAIVKIADNVKIEVAVNAIEMVNPQLNEKSKDKK